MPTVAVVTNIDPEHLITTATLIDCSRYSETSSTRFRFMDAVLLPRPSDGARDDSVDQQKGHHVRTDARGQLSRRGADVFRLSSRFIALSHGERL